MLKGIYYSILNVTYDKVLHSKRRFTFAYLSLVFTWGEEIEVRKQIKQGFFCIYGRFIYKAHLAKKTIPIPPAIPFSRSYLHIISTD